MELKNIIEKKLVSLSIIFFLLAMIFPSITVFVPSFGKSITYDGWYAMLAGSLSLTMNLKQSLVWLANPFYVFALFSMKRNVKLVILFSSLAICNALLFFILEDIQWTWSGRISHIKTVNIGYWLWIASFIVLLISAIINQIRKYKMN